MHARYRIETAIDQGGMGTIYRAYDRLTETWVALKQLNLKPALVEDPATTAENIALRLSLAEEFRLLATLRHPHIVSVLDYGFVQETAFFTMELLTAGTPLVQAALGQSLAVKLQLLGQLLQTLEYLRRRQVVHRDLKPANVLVQAGQVKVLDFGLAVLEGQSATSVGSLLYMAPEAFDDRPATHATDLFAVGVMAYEMLTGQHPFATADINQLIEHILNTEPDYARLQGPQALQATVAQLLAKDPAARFATANDALAALIEASDLPLALETQATRASLIQSAQLVGRGAALAQLGEALRAALAGLGSTWLIGGESGVGKSRLLEELRIQALVRGAWVWQGQAVSEAGQAAQLWQNILRWLVLVVPLADLEAAVLKPFVPTLENLLGRAIADAPELEAKAAQDRFCAVVLALFQRVTAAQPVVLILEDLHWAGAFSRAVLAWLMRAVAELPLLIVATYRNDEQPDLPAALPPAQCLVLPRLNNAQVAELASAIFGLPVAQLTHLITFLYEQTEGNALFVVEVLRSLAEEAGLLQHIQHLALPEHLLVGGMQQVIQRRLQRIGAADTPWLALAAVAGRELDLRLLRALDERWNWAAWLSRCAEAAVLEPQGVAWRFAHEQLRYGVLSTLPEAQHRALHRTLAETLEQVYAEDLAPHLNRLVHHYTRTDQVEKQRHYLWLAGQQAQATPDFIKALDYYERLAALEVDPTLQVDFYLKYGAVLEALGRWPEAEAAYQLALAQATADAEAPAVAHSQKALGKLARQRGDYGAAQDWLAQALAHATAQPLSLAQIHAEFGAVLARCGDYAAAIGHVQTALNIARPLREVSTISSALSVLGQVYDRMGETDLAVAAFNEHSALQRLTGNRIGEAMALGRLGMLKVHNENYIEAQAILEASLALRREAGDKPGIAVATNNLGYALCLASKFAQSRALFQESLALRREMGSKSGEGHVIGNFGLAGYLEGLDYGAALAAYTQSLALGYEIGEKRLIHSDLVGIAACWAKLGQVPLAVQLVMAAEHLRAAMHLKLEPGERRLLQDVLTAGQKTLSAEVFEQAQSAGAAMALDEAVALALKVAANHRLADSK